MTCRIIVRVRDGALRPTAVYRPWASCTFKTGNSCTSYFLSGRFLHKIMLQTARRGKEKNRVLLTSHFCIYTFQRKWKRSKAAWAKACDHTCTLYLSRTTSHMSKLNKLAGYHLSSDFFDSSCGSAQKRVFNLRRLNQVNSTWKKRTSTRCRGKRLDNKNIPCILRTRVFLNAWNFLPYLSQQYM